MRTFAQKLKISLLTLSVGLSVVLPNGLVSTVNAAIKLQNVVPKSTVVTSSTNNLLFAAAAEGPAMNVTVEARYSSNRIYWEAVEGATAYKVLRSETEEGTYTELFDKSITALEYVDENAGVNTQYFYKLEVTTSEGTFTSDALQDTYATGYVALHEHAKAQLHRDYSDDSVFDGSRIETMSDAETDSVKALNKGTVLLVFKPSGENTGSRQIIWGIKNSSTSTATSNDTAGNPSNNISYFLYSTTKLRYDYGYGLKSALNHDTTTGQWNAIAVSNTFHSSGNNIVHSINGNTSGGYGSTQWDNFLSKMSGLNKMYIGGSKNGENNVAMYKGDIAYVTVTDEVLSSAEMNAYTLAMKTMLTLKESITFNNIDVEARYSSNRIYWDAVDGATGYKVLRSESVNGVYTELTADAMTATEYIDESAETGKMYYYKIQVTTNAGTLTSDPENDEFVPGIEAVHEHAKAQLHRDYTKNPVFDGTRVEVMSSEETAIVAGLSKATVLLVMQPDGVNTGEKQVVFNIKDADLTTPTGNSATNNPANNVAYYLFNQTSIRYDHGYGLRATLNNSTTANQWNAIGVSHTTYTSGNNIVHSVNGQSASGFGGASWDNFLSKLTGLDLMTIGGSINAGENATEFHGKIAYVTITDEVLSPEEMNEYTAAVIEKLNNTPYNIAHQFVNPDIVNKTTLRYTDGHLMDGRTVGTFATLFDGDRDSNNSFDFGTNGKSGYVEIDLGSYYDVSSINALFNYSDERSYNNVVVMVSENRQFTLDDVVYNNDRSNVHGFGTATDVDNSNETAEGRTIEFEARKARFVRVYMAGNSTGDGKNEIVELEVYGLPSQTPEFTKTQDTVDLTSKEWLYESTIDGVNNYVSPDVLRVKAQAELTEDGKVNVRFVSSVASEKLEKVRFRVEVINGSQIRKNSVATKKVYEEIAVNNGQQVLFENPQSVFDNPASKYFFVAKLNNIPESAKSQLVRVTPCWLPLGYEDVDSNYVDGISRTFVISEFFDYAN